MISQTTKNPKYYRWRNENTPEIPDFLSDVFVLANVLNDISNFETGQILVQNNSQDKS
jgi:hypothetical protein